MHIAIDARMYGTAQRGIGRYLMKLIEQLEIVEAAPPLTPPRKGGETERFPPLPEGRIKEGWEFTIFLRRANFDEYQPRNPNFKKALWDAPWYGIKEQLFFRPLYKGANYESSANLRISNSKIRKFEYHSQLAPLDLYHFPHWNVPFFFKRPFIVTIHDLELFSSNRTRESTTRGRLAYWLKHLAFRMIFRHAVLASRAIIVPSNVVREQLLDLYPQVRKKVQVIYEAPTIQGLGTRVLGISKLQNPRPYPLIPIPYILYVGSAYPHKNLPRLLEAWKIVHQELPDFKLVLVGREDFFWKKLKTTSYVLRPTSSTIFYGPATDQELATLYKNAALLVQPSLEEGFSLPPLEALSFGTPVAVSDIAVHREILGEAALFFDPTTAAAIAQTLKQGLVNAVVRQQLLHHSKTVLSRYSWKSHAQATLHLYGATEVE